MKGWEVGMSHRASESKEAVRRRKVYVTKHIQPVTQEEVEECKSKNWKMVRRVNFEQEGDEGDKWQRDTTVLSAGLIATTSSTSDTKKCSTPN